MVARGPISTDLVVVCSVGDSCWGWVPSLLQSTAQTITAKEQPLKACMQINVTFVKCECDACHGLGNPISCPLSQPTMCGERVQPPLKRWRHPHLLYIFFFFLKKEPYRSGYIFIPYCFHYPLQLTSSQNCIAQTFILAIPLHYVILA
jgi:hypothetical protein